MKDIPPSHPQIKKKMKVSLQQSATYILLGHYNLGVINNRAEVVKLGFDCSSSSSRPPTRLAPPQGHPIS